jgi:hypothetical protein
LDKKENWLVQRFLKRYFLWLIYAAFLILASLFGSREAYFSINGGHGLGKFFVLTAYVTFLAYSVYATKRENFFKSLMSVNRLWWGRQIGADLYISVFLSLGLIYLIEGSLFVTLAWLVPILFFANLAILPYILLNYSFVLQHLVS